MADRLSWFYKIAADPILVTAKEIDFMGASELQRLAQDVKSQPSLSETLSEELKQCRSPEEAALMLQRRGYLISAEDLKVTGSAMPDDALDHVVGGNGLSLGALIGSPLQVAIDEQVRQYKGFNWPP